MANATQTLAGDIQLSGDLGGSNDASSPQLSLTGVTVGTYTFPSITVDAKGRITVISQGSLNGDVVGSPIANTLSTTGVIAGSYGIANITVDAKGRIIAASNGTLSGDVTGVYNATVLAPSGVTAGTYTAANITVDTKGRITAAANGTLNGDIKGAAGANYLSNSGVVAGSYSIPSITVDAKGRITAATNGSITLIGDVSGLYNATVLAPSGVTAGTYTAANITVDTKGRITSATNGVAATSTTPGLVKIASNSGLTVDAGGYLSLAPASSSVRGGVISANTNYITITNGAISVGDMVVRTDKVNTFTYAYRFVPEILAVGGAIDSTRSPVRTISMTTNGTLAAPTNLANSGQLIFVITQDATGGRTLAFDPVYRFAAGADKLISSAAGSVSILKCWYVGTSLYCSLAKNFV